MLTDQIKSDLVWVVITLAADCAQRTGILTTNISDAQARQYVEDCRPHIEVMGDQSGIEIKYKPLELVKVSPGYGALPAALMAPSVQKCITDLLAKSPVFDGVPISIKSA